MNIDIILEAGARPEAVAELAEIAEQNGIHTLWSSAFAARRDPLVGLALAATRTKTLRLGYMPVSSFEQQPMKIADGLLTLNELSAGRAAILLGGLGKSSMMAMGLEPTRRVTATRETVEIVKGAATAQFLSYKGEIYQAQGDYASWVTQHPPLVYVAANRELMLRKAAPFADGVMFSDITADHLPSVLSHLDEGLHATGKSRDPFRVNNFWAWHVKQDKQSAINEARQELVWRGALQREHIAQFIDPEECDLVEAKWQNFLQAFIQKTPKIEDVPDSIVERLVDGLTLTGDLNDIDQIAERLRAMEAEGQTEIALRMHADPADAIRMIGEHLIPQLS